MKFTKYNNPNKRRKPRRKIDRTDADIIAAKAFFDDQQRGTAQPLKYYDRLSDQISGNESRNIYE